MSGKIEPIVGRYVHVEIDGVMHRIYFEIGRASCRERVLMPV